MLDEMAKEYAETNSVTYRAHLRKAASCIFEYLFDTTNVGQLTETEIIAGVRDGKIPAIRLYRERTGLGLKDSKDHVEHYFTVNNLQFKGY